LRLWWRWLTGSIGSDSVKWFADAVSSHMAGFSPATATLALLLINFFAHSMFAGGTAHVTALIPVLLALGSAVPYGCI
jgi:L-tartrate/succinate antiporter